jgi:multisubunit Na+/H+ antiporter MnhG subunit
MVLVTSRAIVWNSVIGLERFPDTFNPGYFIVKLALWLLALLMLIEGMIGLFRPHRQEPDQIRPV